MKKYLFIIILISCTGCLDRADEYGLIQYNGHDLILNKEYLPYSVFYTKETPVNVDDSIRSINNSFGIKIFLISSLWELEIKEHAPLGTVFFNGVFFLNQNILASTRLNHREDGIIESVNIELLIELSEEIYSYIVIHELGHALGLDHDDNSCSIMYPTLEGGHFCSWKEREFTKSDINLIREKLMEKENVSPKESY